MASKYPSKGDRFRASLNEETITIICERLKNGDLQHDIAADLGINQGRVSEVKTGKRGSPPTGQASLF